MSNTTIDNDDICFVSTLLTESTGLLYVIGCGAAMASVAIALNVAFIPLLTRCATVDLVVKAVLLNYAAIFVATRVDNIRRHGKDASVYLHSNDNHCAFAMTEYDCTLDQAAIGSLNVALMFASLVVCTERCVTTVRMRAHLKE